MESGFVTSIDWITLFYKNIKKVKKNELHIWLLKLLF